MESNPLIFARTLASPRQTQAAWLTSALGVLVALAIMAASVSAFAASAPESFADLAEKLLPSVVNISSTQAVEGRTGPELPQLPPGSPFEDFFKDFFDRNRPQGPKSRRATSLGSGFIINVKNNGDSFVVTNNHVIEGADEITVILQDDTRLPAELVGRDKKTDLAVLKIRTDKKLTSVGFGDSDKARVGDWIVAIGNPFGLGGTVTAGIISARGRDINSGPYDDFIQTDASINKGNSGGPMFNLKGEVIGINTAIFSPTGGSVGIGFAVPSSTAAPVIRQLIKHGLVRRGWLGVHIQTVTEEIAESLGLKKAAGALVASVIEDGPAEKGKIKAGDVILKFNGKDITEMRKLPRVVADTEVEKTVDVVIWRNNEKITLKVNVGDLKEDEAKVAAKGGGKAAGTTKIKSLGLTLSAVNDRLRQRYKLDKDAKGVVVTGVDSEGAAADKGIRPGDVIVEVSQQEVATPANIVTRIDEASKAGRKSVLLLLEGQAGLRFVAVRIDKG